MLYARCKEEHIRLARNLQHPFTQPPLLEEEPPRCSSRRAQASEVAEAGSSARVGAQQRRRSQMQKFVRDQYLD